MSASRQTGIAITWTAKDNGPDGLLQFGGQPRDISREILPHLLGLSYTDNLTSAADDLAIELEDRDSLWSGDWRPEFGDTVEASVTATPWLTQVDTLRLGTFAHDKISLSGPPRKATIKAVSAPLATGLRRTKRNHNWSGVSLFQIASDIADRAGLDLDWTGDEGFLYKRREQKDKSDLEFLDEACKEVGRALKVCESTRRPGKFQIVIFREEERDAEDSIGEIDLHGGKVLSWNFDSDDSGRYGNCHLKFFDPRNGKTIEAQFPPVGTSAAGYAALGLDPDGQTIEVRLPVDNAGDAVEICKGKLRAANRFANAGRLTVIGDPGLVAGVTFDLVNAHGFNGKFIVTKAAHSFVNGYTCALDVRRCVEGF